MLLARVASSGRSDRGRGPKTSYFRARSPARMLATASPFNTAWLPPGYGQKLWKAALGRLFPRRATARDVPEGRNRLVVDRLTRSQAPSGCGTWSALPRGWSGMTCTVAMAVAVLARPHPSGGGADRPRPV